MRTFVNDDLENKFMEDGYVVVKGLEEDGIQYLTQLYEQHYEPIAQPGFNSSLEENNPELSRAIIKGLRHVFQPANERLFVDHLIFFGALLLKKPDEVGEVGPHMDWTFVDEKRYCSANMWCPLVDVNKENGGISLLKGSHKWSKSLRGDRFPHRAYDVQNIVSELLESGVEDVELKKGEAVVFHHRTVHFSGTNRSDKDRLAGSVTLVPKEAQTCHHFMQPNGRVFKYATNTEFMVNYKFGEQPSDLCKIDEFDYRIKPLTMNDIRSQ